MALAKAATLPKILMASDVFMTLLNHRLDSNASHSFKNLQHHDNMQGDRVKEAMDSKGWRTADLRRAMAEKGYRVTEQAIGKWFKGTTKNIQSEYLFAIEDLTGYRARWLSEGRLPKKVSEEIVDGFLSHIIDMYKGLSLSSKDKLADYANLLYISDNSNDKRANPYPTKPKEADQK